MKGLRNLYTAWFSPATKTIPCCTHDTPEKKNKNKKTLGRAGCGSRGGDSRDGDGTENSVPDPHQPFPCRLPRGLAELRQSCQLIFSSVPSLAPAPTSSPRSASRPPPQHALYKRSQNHLGLSQPRTQTDSKPPGRGCRPTRKWDFGAIPPLVTPLSVRQPQPGAGSSQKDKNALARGMGVMLGVARQRGEGLIIY